MREKRPTILYVRESAVQSVVADTYMFLGMLGLLWFNHQVLSGNIIIDLIFILMMFIVAANRGSKRYKRFYTNQEVIEYLQKEETK